MGGVGPVPTIPRYLAPKKVSSSTLHAGFFVTALALELGSYVPAVFTEQLLQLPTNVGQLIRRMTMYCLQLK